ncbi:pyruvate decarboxylase [Cryphonectria parasitica EP155]|uniref:Pyruvate decarboxylase n=1 Tax=Cryphonectria parasitica (strain ATCC 38755 / EP155) TaxID=660469 RepID=A0A9P4XWU9_CRYP1|nr:pyruvate decarboxylase [Cryphonectria parasitica EP155]KAF3762802.1 pyruvate decarboxylase [Cryphonectria parasitica EP155]
MSEILVGEYLFRRLRELDVGTLFGVPGDYELALLDLLEPEGLSWVGTPNELVGAYAADGYAREKGFGALVTTFGPGELSALCGIGGAFCEHVPILHIVGYPTRQAQGNGRIYHHTLGDLRYDHFVTMSGELSCATAVLEDAQTAASEIDRVINAMLYYSRPGYIGISEDIAYSKIPLSSLDTKLVTTLPPGNVNVENLLIEKILTQLSAAKQPVLLVDGGAARSSWAKFVPSLMDALKVPVLTTLLGKGAVDESSPYYVGGYVGGTSLPEAKEIVETADLVLWLGSLPSDCNTAGFSVHLGHGATVVDFQRFCTKFNEESFESKITQILPKLTAAIRADDGLAGRTRRIKQQQAQEIPTPTSITQDYLWARISSFNSPGDLVITETGTSQFGFNSVLIPPDVKVWTQAVWGSIGYAAGAAVGLSIAAKEMGHYKRIVLFTGEGSLQMTVQALSILSRHGITPVVFILNNKGYTVERYFNGMKAAYNDVPMWDYTAIFRALATEVDVKTFCVGKTKDLDSLLSDEAFQKAGYAQCVELLLEADDLPTTMRAFYKSIKQ